MAEDTGTVVLGSGATEEDGSAVDQAKAAFAGDCP